jgi:hypothetical protein
VWIVVKNLASMGHRASKQIKGMNIATVLKPVTPTGDSWEARAIKNCLFVATIQKLV